MICYLFPLWTHLPEKIATHNNVRLPQRKTFASDLEREYATMEANLKAELEEVDFVSTTADIWTANNRSYMGIIMLLHIPPYV